MILGNLFTEFAENLPQVQLGKFGKFLVNWVNEFPNNMHYDVYTCAINVDDWYVY